MRHRHRHAMREMASNFENPDEARARFYVWRLRRFYFSLIAYGLLVPFLFTINSLTFHGYWWAAWPTAIMGMVLLLKGLKLLGRRHMLNDEWEEKKVQHILARKKAP
jgi:hypothetical protein